MRRDITLPYTAEEMFAVADDIERYPQFLPWCAGADVRRGQTNPQTQEQQVSATLHINYRGLKAAFSTDNTHRKPAQITMTLAGGGGFSALSSLRGEWRFDAAKGGCRTVLDLEYDFGNKMMAAIFSTMFDRFFCRFAECFAARARDLYGAREIKIEVVGAGDDGHYWSRELTMPKGATILDAARAAGAKLPAEDAEAKVGIWGRQKPPQTTISEGDRVEIYEPLAIDPRAARKARAQKA
ncbi:MAG: RnfH family protein [Gammaproteobacteria bacterium]